MDIFEFALKMEEDGKRFYEQLAAETSVPELRNLYTLLAAAEEEHRNALILLKGKIAPANTELMKVKEVKNVFQTLMERKHLPEVLKKDLDGCRRAIGMAMAGIKTYERMGEKETNAATAKVIAMLADEEEKLLQLMESIYDFVEAPKDFLVSAEFSNLREL